MVSAAKRMRSGSLGAEDGATSPMVCPGARRRGLMSGMTRSYRALTCPGSAASLPTTMSPTKRTAIRAGHILAFDGRGHRLLRDGVVVIEGDRILHVGPALRRRAWTRRSTRATAWSPPG